VRGSIRNNGLVCQENIGSKMWGEAQMTAPGVHSDIRSYEKSAYLTPVVKKTSSHSISG